uniref:DSBA-like thioredoxin domain-containing protein n=1 Tax=Acrobeloides nanus TaxID=290746 RepID=A0A914EL82_9BILA
MSSKSKALVTLYFDVISPYSWIAFESLSRYEKVLPITLKLKPLFLGGLIRTA